MVIRTLILAALVWPYPFAHATNVVVNASYLNVRNANGSILCAVPDGTQAEAIGRDAEDGRIQVRFAKLPRTCPAQAQGAFVSGAFLAVSGRDAKEHATVGIESLGLFSKPINDPAQRRCTLKMNSVVKVVDKKYAMSDDTPWIEVQPEPAVAGCPATGFVLKDLLEVARPLQNLPVVKIGNGERTDCCSNHASSRPAAVNDLNHLSGQIGKKLGEGAKHSPPQAQKATSNQKVEALARAAKTAAAKYRSYAPFVCRRRGLHHPCGGSSDPHRSKGWCLAGVSEAVQQVFGYPVPGGAMGAASGSKAFLDRHFTKLAVHSCKEAPRGAICLYDRRPVHNFGHIEIKADEHSYCSDFCATNPLRVGKFMGAYMPPAGGNK